MKTRKHMVITGADPGPAEDDTSVVAAEPLREFTVNSKTVVLKSRLPLFEGHLLKKHLLLIGQDADYRQQVPVLAMMIETWDFEGDPKDPAAYDALDTFTEFLPLANKVGEYVQFKLNPPDLKN